MLARAVRSHRGLVAALIILGVAVVEKAVDLAAGDAVDSGRDAGCLAGADLIPQFTGEHERIREAAPGIDARAGNNQHEFAAPLVVD